MTMIMEASKHQRCKDDCRRKREIKKNHEFGEAGKGQMIGREGDLIYG